VLRGDVNSDGKVSAADAQAILTNVVGLPLPVGYHPTPNGDITCSGATLTALDAQVVLSYIVGLPTQAFCVGAIR
jgi:Dockerin type I domain